MRRATLAQVGDARSLLNEYFAEVAVVDRDTPENVHGFLSSPDSGFWIAYVGDIAAGCVTLRPLEGNPTAGECKRLYVRSRFRRLGIAAALMEALEQHARQRALQWIYLDSKQELQAAVALYLARNYEECERYNASLDATVFLRKSLAAD